jgi:hypothetical protein
LDTHAYRQNENSITRIPVDNALSFRARYAITLDYVYAGGDHAFDVITAVGLRERIEQLAENGVEHSDALGAA